MGESTPSENEWLIMEGLWNHEGAMTAAEIIEEMKDTRSLNKNTIKVMINRLLGKKVIDYQVYVQCSYIHFHFPCRSFL